MRLGGSSLGSSRIASTGVELLTPELKQGLSGPQHCQCVTSKVEFLSHEWD